MIVKMSGWVSPPQPQDYDAIIGNISALNRAVFGQRVIITEYNSLLLPRLSVGSVIQHGGVLYVVQEEEYEISGSVSQGVNYIRVATDGETLAVEWVTSRNGYSWNPVYGYLADGSGRQLLPYKVVRDGDDYEKSHLSEMGIWAGGKIEGESLVVGGKIEGETINTGQGELNLYPMVGAVVAFAMTTPPAGWLKCNGQAVSRTTYAALFSKIGTVFGAGNGTTTFNLPELRGEFVRGLADGRSVDTGRGLGTAQGQAIQSHAHSYYATDTSSSIFGGLVTGGDVVLSYQLEATGSAGGAETRPRNVALLYCIKF